MSDDTVDGTVLHAPPSDAGIGSVHVTGPSSFRPRRCPSTVRRGAAARPGAAASVLCAPGRRRRGPARRERRDARAGGAVPGPHRGGARDPGRLGRAGAPPVRARGQARHQHRQRPRHGGLRLPRARSWSTWSTSTPATAFTVHRGDRIAQLVVQQVARVEFLEVDSLEATSRGDTGHGASGGFGDHTPTTKD